MNAKRSIMTITLALMLVGLSSSPVMANQLTPTDAPKIPLDCGVWASGCNPLKVPELEKSIP